MLTGCKFVQPSQKHIWDIDCKSEHTQIYIYIIIYIFIFI